MKALIQLEFAWTHQKNSMAYHYYCVFMNCASRIRFLFSLLNNILSPFPPGPSSGITFGSNSFHSHGGYASSAIAATGACPLSQLTPSRTVPSGHDEIVCAGQRVGHYCTSVYVFDWNSPAPEALDDLSTEAGVAVLAYRHGDALNHAPRDAESVGGRRRTERKDIVVT